MEESFKIKAGNGRLDSIVGLKVVMDFNSYSIMRDGNKIALIRFSGEAWDQIEGDLTTEEVNQIGDAIESHYM